MTSGVRPPVLCAACGSRFDAAEAATGDRVDCPLCGEVVEVARLAVERRRVRKSPPASPREPRRLSSGDLRRVAVRLLVASAVGLGLVGLWMARDSIASVFRDAAARSAKPR